MTILIQFIFRLSFGLALAMWVTPARFVTSGFYRVHLYVLMGLNVLAALAAWSHSSREEAWLAGVVAAMSYVGSALWLYEKPRAGSVALGLISVVSLLGAIQAADLSATATLLDSFLKIADLGSSGILIGVTLAAMLLGHWYLNTPTMDLVPLRRLVRLLLVAVMARSLICGIGMMLRFSESANFGADSTTLALLALRWLSGLVGMAVLTWMTWETLKIPNTQSATGILYVGVIVTFLGELTSQLLSGNLPYPV